MKKLLFLFIISCFSLQSFAQDPQLFENTWYLQNVIIDGNDNFPPSNSEVPFITVNFYPTEFFTAVCDALSGSIIYDMVNPEFTINAGMTLGGCTIQENSNFQIIYLEDFYFNHMSDAFSYVIVDEGNGSKTLTVTNSSVNESIYSSELLSTQEFLTNLFSIYPNPVKEKLFISTIPDLTDFKIIVFNIDGKQVLLGNEIDLNNKSIDIQLLTSGIYFIMLKDKQGRTEMKKFIKN